MSWQSIISKLTNRGANLDTIALMLSFIDAIEPAIELQTALEGFSKTLPHIRNLIKHYPTNSASIHHATWEAICQELLTSPAYADLLESTRKSGKQPLRGHYDESPVYVALWHRPKEQELYSVYYQLLAHILIIARI